MNTADSRAQCFDDGNDALELFVDVTRRSAPGRVDSPPTSMMAAPSPTMRARVLERRAAIAETAAVGEGIGRDVEHAHDHGYAEIEDSIAAPPAGDDVLIATPAVGGSYRQFSAGRRASRWLPTTIGLAFGALRRRRADRIIPVGGRLRMHARP